MIRSILASGKMPLSESENLHPSLGASGSKPVSPLSPTRQISKFPKSRLELIKNTAMTALPPIIPSHPISKAKGTKIRRPISPSQVPLPASPQKRRPPTSTSTVFVDLTGDEDKCGVGVDPLSAQHPRKRQAVSRRPSINKLVYDVSTKRSDMAEIDVDTVDPFVGPLSSQISDTGTLCIPLSQNSEATLVEDMSSSQRHFRSL